MKGGIVVKDKTPSRKKKRNDKKYKGETENVMGTTEDRKKYIKQRKCAKLAGEKKCDKNV